MADRLIRMTTALAVVAVAAVISYRHAYELVRSHGESGITARLMPFTVDGLIWAASMVILDASRRNQAVPELAKWSLGVGIVATIGANVAHGLNHGAISALISAWPALALVGSYELLMLLTRNATSPQPADPVDQFELPPVRRTPDLRSPVIIRKDVPHARTTPSGVPATRGRAGAPGRQTPAPAREGSGD